MRVARCALVVWALMALLACAVAASHSVASAPNRANGAGARIRSPNPISPANPRGRTRFVSKTSYHTDAGRERDTYRSFAGEGTSHLRHFGKSAVAPADAPRALMHDAAVNAQLRGLIARSMGAQHTDLVPSIATAASGAPEQVRLSLTARPGEMVVSWLTWSPAASAVRFSTSPGAPAAQAELVRGDVFEWVDPNSLHLVRYMHNVVLKDLKASTQYYYRCGDDEQNVWSDEFGFRSAGDGSEVMRIALYGDLGLVNSQSMEGLSNAVQKKTIDAAIHVGDWAYNMDELEGLMGDTFFNELQNVTAHIPLMGCAGNHEMAYNFSHYTNRFSAWNYVNDARGPHDNNWWFSFDVASGGALTHFISLDSEVYYWNFYEPMASPERVRDFKDMIRAQWEWLVADLTQAYDSGKYAWIVAFAHRPLYCSNVDDVDDCTVDTAVLREGIGGKYGWEEAFAVRPLDFYFAAHEHSYERLYPTARNGTIDRGSVVNDHLYVNPKFPVHVITGSAGCREYFDWFDEVHYGPWSVVRSATYGYGHLIVHNRTHLQWEQLLDEGRGGTDQLWILKDSRVKRPDQEDGEEQMDGNGGSDNSESEVELRGAATVQDDQGELPITFAQLNPPRIADM